MLRPKLPQPQVNESQLEHTLHFTNSIKIQSCKTNSGEATLHHFFKNLTVKMHTNANRERYTHTHTHLDLGRPSP